MRTFFQCAFFLMWAILAAPGAFATDRDDAVTAAQELMQAIAAKKYELAYDEYTSKWLKDRSPTKQASVTNMIFSRSSMGPLLSSQIYDVSQQPADPQFGYTGMIYSITFLNTYPAGKVLERFALIKEGDRYLMSGMQTAMMP